MQPQNGGSVSSLLRNHHQLTAERSQRKAGAVKKRVAIVSREFFK
jgi:hypothetical protein